MKHNSNWPIVMSTETVIQNQTGINSLQFHFKNQAFTREIDWSGKFRKDCTGNRSKNQTDKH